MPVPVSAISYGTDSAPVDCYGRMLRNATVLRSGMGIPVSAISYRLSSTIQYCQLRTVQYGGTISAISSGTEIEYGHTSRCYQLWIPSTTRRRLRP
eukprot:3924240-Rhodomonas_salina.4